MGEGSPIGLAGRLPDEWVANTLLRTSLGFEPHDRESFAGGEAGDNDPATEIWRTS